MAFSMFLRRPACLTKAFSQQMARLATQPALSQTAITKSIPASTLGIHATKTTPILNAVRSIQARSLRTSPVALAAAEKAHDHARLWVIERATSALLLVVIPAALLYPNKILDCAMAILVTAHSFWGLEAIAVDYVRESMFGTFIPKIAIGLVYAISIATLAGLFYVISHDIGIANTVRSFWAIKSEQKSS